jgi:hypothetical protein
MAQRYLLVFLHAFDEKGNSVRIWSYKSNYENTETITATMVNAVIAQFAQYPAVSQYQDSLSQLIGKPLEKVLPCEFSCDGTSLNVSKVLVHIVDMRELDKLVFEPLSVLVHCLFVFRARNTFYVNSS